MSAVTRREALAIAIGASLLQHKAVWAQAIAWRFVRDDLDTLYKPLPLAMPLADCKWLKDELAAIQKRISQLGPEDVHRFKDRVSAEGPKLQAALKQVEKEIKLADKDFQIGSISTVVGCVLSVLGLVFTAEFAVGALVAAQLFAVVGFAAASAFCCAMAWMTVAFLAFLTPGVHLPPLAPIIGELAMTVLFYAPTALVAGWLHHRLVGASRGDI